MSVMQHESYESYVDGMNHWQQSVRQALVEREVARIQALPINNDPEVRAWLAKYEQIGESQLPSEIQALHLRSKELDKLPDWIGQLTELTELHLSGNQLSTVPESIGQLTALTTLGLSGNQLSTVPESIGQLTALTTLGLRGNQLSTVPESIGQLTALTTLGLRGNQLSTVPESIGQLTALTSLHLSGNQLSTVPESIGQLTALTTLGLSGNQLSTVPESIGQLTALTTLGLTGNPLIEIPESVAKLDCLKELIAEIHLEVEARQERKRVLELPINNDPEVRAWLVKYARIADNELPSEIQSLDVQREGLTGLPDWIDQLTGLPSEEITRLRLELAWNQKSLLQKLFSKKGY